LVEDDGVMTFKVHGNVRGDCVNDSASKKVGDEGEGAVASWLQSQGYVIIACNYRARGGEIDIIAEKKDTVAFVEVKTRRNMCVDISEVVNYTKQQRIIQAARTYIASNACVSVVYRFDVALVKKCHDSFDILYVEDAFQYDND
jgi:putative endonuclease